jgi:Flp pilus assembly protein TadG
MMSSYRRRKLAGQAIIIFTLAIMAMTGLLVIAVDGGAIYLDKRRLQNAADAGALAGGDATESLPLRSYSVPHQAALNEIYHNLFPGTAVPTVPGAATATYATTAFSGTYRFVLTADVANLSQDTYQVYVYHAYTFYAAQALGFGSSTCTLGGTTTSNAVCLAARAKALAATYPFALILLDDQNTNYENLQLNGAPSKLILHDGGTKGGAISNESMSAGSGNIYFNPCGGSGDLWAANESSAGASNIPSHSWGHYGDIGVYPACTVNTLNTPYPKPTVKIPFPNYPEPPVTGPTYSPSLTASGGTYYLCPGLYQGSISESSPGSQVILYPGVYRFTSPIALTLSGGTLRGATAADYPLPGGAVAINCTGYNTSSAPSDLGLVIELKAPDCTTNTFSVSGGSTNITLRPSPRYNNISFYIELFGPYPGLGCSTSTPAGSHVVNISGQANLNIYGAFYGPGDNMFFCGNGSGYGVGQIIAWTMQICGNGTVDEHYNPAYLPYFRGLIQ